MNSMDLMYSMDSMDSTDSMDSIDSMDSTDSMDSMDPRVEGELSRGLSSYTCIRTLAKSCNIGRGRVNGGSGEGRGKVKGGSRGS